MKMAVRCYTSQIVTGTSGQTYCGCLSYKGTFDGIISIDDGQRYRGNT
jgi:hypothetical protein